MSERGGDWRSGPAYDYVDEIGVEKIAHEFLRRNDQYAADYALLRDQAYRRATSAGARAMGVAISRWTRASELTGRSRSGCRRSIRAWHC